MPDDEVVYRPVGEGRSAGHPKWRDALTTVVANLYLRAHRNVTIDGYVLCTGRPPRLLGKGTVHFGRRVVLRTAVTRSLIGAAKGASLSIGAGTFVNEGCSVVAHENMVIGGNVSLGEYSGLFDTDHHEVDEGRGVRHAPVTIADNVWIGRQVVVLPGVSIGRHSVVASGSVVTRSVGERELVAGNPAGVVREVAVRDDDWRRA